MSAPTSSADFLYSGASVPRTFSIILFEIPASQWIALKHESAGVAAGEIDLHLLVQRGDMEGQANAKRCRNDAANRTMRDIQVVNHLPQSDRSSIYQRDAPTTRSKI